MSTPSVVSKFLPVQKYTWGNNCRAWTFVENENLSIKQEEMPPETEEVLHYHNYSQQFFYILKGKAVFEIDDVILIVHKGEGINIEPKQKHRIMNKEEETTLEFLVCSQPSTQKDRYNLV